MIGKFHIKQVTPKSAQSATAHFVTNQNVYKPVPRVVQQQNAPRLLQTKVLKV